MKSPLPLDARFWLTIAALVAGVIALALAAAVYMTGDRSPESLAMLKDFALTVLKGMAGLVAVWVGGESYLKGKLGGLLPGVDDGDGDVVRSGAKAKSRVMIGELDPGRSVSAAVDELDRSIDEAQGSPFSVRPNVWEAIENIDLPPEHRPEWRGSGVFER